MTFFTACMSSFSGRLRRTGIFMWGYGDIVAKVSAATCAMIGGLLGISSAIYYKKTPLVMPDDETVVDSNSDVGEG